MRPYLTMIVTSNYCRKIEAVYSAVTLKENGRGIFPRPYESLFLYFFLKEQDGIGIEYNLGWFRGSGNTEFVGRLVNL